MCSRSCSNAPSQRSTRGTRPRRRKCLAHSSSLLRKPLPCSSHASVTLSVSPSPFLKRNSVLLAFLCACIEKSAGCRSMAAEVLGALAEHEDIVTLCPDLVARGAAVVVAAWCECPSHTNTEWLNFAPCEQQPLSEQAKRIACALEDKVSPFITRRVLFSLLIFFTRSFLFFFFFSFLFYCRSYFSFV